MMTWEFYGLLSQKSVVLQAEIQITIKYFKKLEESSVPEPQYGEGPEGTVCLLRTNISLTIPLDGKLTPSWGSVLALDMANRSAFFLVN